jgi:glycosyltransferase involved in cell wall biosynthesis
MKIAMIGVKGIPASMALGGGIERQIENVAPRLAALGHDVTVYVRSHYNPRGLVSWNGCRLVTIPTIQRKNFETIVHVLLSTIHALGTRYDIIHYHGVGPSTLAWIPRLFKPHAKVVVTFHSRDQFHEKWNVLARAYLAFGEWTAIAIPHATIAVSHVIQQFCKRMFRRTPYFIPNGVFVPDREFGTNHVRAMGLRPNGYFLGLGRLIPHKAFDVAIRAYRDVPTAIEFAIAGAPGYDERYAEDLHAMAELDERVHMLGFRTGEELQQLIAHCYALVHPSRSEGLSLAVLEAMGHGKVVIMSDIPENLELIDHSGISFPVDDVAKLRDVLAWAASDEELLRERGRRAQEFVRKHFSWDSIVDKHLRVYEALLRGAK